MERHYPCIGVVADDLPGAIIAGAALRRSGLRVVVVSGDSEGRAWPSQADAVVVSAGSREVAAGAVATTPQRGEDLVSSYVRRLRVELHCKRIEVRVDAALRRDYSPEVEAALLAAKLADPVVLAVVAMPSAGRLTRQGRQTAFVADGDEYEILVARHIFGDLGAHVVSEDVVESGADAVVEDVEAGLARTRRFVIDATREEHLATIAAAALVLETRYELLTVSSGAWLSYFPGAASAFVLVAVGLPTPPTERQLKALMDCRECRLLTVRQAMQLAISSPDELSDRLAGAEVVVLLAESDEDHSPPHTDAERLAAAERVAEAVEGLLFAAQRSGVRCNGVLGVGAFTTARLVRTLGGTTVVPTGDSDPHTPTCVIATGAWTGLKVVAKGGLIGGPGTLVDLVALMAGESHQAAP
jgi:uncharacterized protein YgbK (DUF1537 family)